MHHLNKPIAILLNPFLHKGLPLPNLRRIRTYNFLLPPPNQHPIPYPRRESQHTGSSLIFNPSTALQTASYTFAS